MLINDVIAIIYAHSFHGQSTFYCTFGIFSFDNMTIVYVELALFVTSALCTLLHDLFT